MATNLNLANGATIMNLPAVSPGNSCTTNGGLGISNGYAVTCSSGTWQQPPAWGTINPGPGNTQTIGGALNGNNQQIYNTGPISSNGTVSSGAVNSGTINASGAVTATGDTTLWHGVIWTWWQPMAYGAGGNSFYFMPAGWWPAPSYWWTNVPGYSGCGGQNPSGGVNMPWGSFQVWQVGSCNNWWKYVPGGPYGY